MAGYSGTPLPRKLGIKSGHSVALVNAPEGFAQTLGDVPEEVSVRWNLRGRGRFDVLVFFTDRRAELQRHFPRLVSRIVDDGGLWIGWPKKASGVETDLTGGVVRSIGLDGGLVDVKVCAIDDTWSGLRFVVRVEDRPRRS